MAGDRLKAFEWIKKHGSTMKQVVPVFPPYDLPVWTSLATGLYPKNTGVSGDYMYNIKVGIIASCLDEYQPIKAHQVFNGRYAVLETLC